VYLKSEEVKRLKQLEEENRRLKKVVADLLASMGVGPKCRKCSGI
jgi:hypothetical protein